MCALCGVLGGTSHWTDAAARAGRVHAQCRSACSAGASGRIASPAPIGVLALLRPDAQRLAGALLRPVDRTGKTEIVDDLGHLWPAAEKLLGRPCDPLDPDADRAAGGAAMAEATAFMPVNLITGFLGSGKTTLLQRLLADPALADTAVLINEFGEVGLDHHLLERIDDTMVLLQSGCLCCTIRGELAAAIKDLHSRRERGQVPPFRRLVVESTGLADPFPILSTVRPIRCCATISGCGNVITTVDAVNGLSSSHASPNAPSRWPSPTGWC